MRPSLLIIPANETPGVLMPQIPFNGTADFTVSRTTTPANNSTRVNSSGLIEIVNDNVPRIDYLNQSCPALLVEPSGQNWIPQGDNMSSFLTFTLGGAIAPSKSATLSLSGQSNAVSVIGGNGSVGSFGIYQFIPTGLTSGQTVTYSVFAKAGTNNFMSIHHANAAGTGGGVAFFDLSNGTTTTANARIENYGNGWYRCIMPPFTFTSNPVGSYNIGHYVTPNAITNSWSTSYLNRSVTFYGGQLEIGSVATSYIPTLSTAPVTRNADVISVTGVAGLIGQTEGTMYVEMIAVSGVNTSRLLSVTESNIPTNNRVIFNIDSLHRLEVIVRSNNTNTNGSISPSAATLLANGINKIAYAYNGVTGGNALAINGSVVATNAQTFAFTQALSLVNVARSEINLTIATNQRIRAAALYTTRLSNDDLIRLTLPSTYVTYNDMALGLAYTIK